WMSDVCSFVFFFQAEDGIRDRNVTGVQTCALPIWIESLPVSPHHLLFQLPQSLPLTQQGHCHQQLYKLGAVLFSFGCLKLDESKIGRASCRERVVSGVDGGVVEEGGAGEESRGGEA